MWGLWFLDCGHGEGQPQAVLWSTVSELYVGLSHDVVLLHGEGAGQEGLGNACKTEITVKKCIYETLIISDMTFLS